jgi:acyl transferase domain-containing protein
VTGVNIIDFPGTAMTLGGLGGVLSPDGKCFSFDHRANGYGRGEGVGTVIVKRLDAALRDKNTIRAVIRGTGSNQDGRTPGIALPSMEAQERLIRQVYASAGLDMGHTRYFEAHGTGTPAGDPIEAGAIAAAFNSSASNDQPLYIGSIKANIGHLEGAAGIAGVIKAVLMVEKGVIPPAANFEKANAKIPLQEWNMRIATNPVPWPTTGVRRVSVNSFGFGGTNAHVILDDAYSVLKERDLNAPIASSITQDEGYSLLLNDIDDPLANGCSSTRSNGVSDSNDIDLPLANGNGSAHSNGVSLLSGIGSSHAAGSTSELSHGSVFIISTADEAGIQRNATKLSQHIRSLLTDSPSPPAESQYLSDLAYTLTAKRSMFKWKAFCIAGSQQDLVANLQGRISKPIQKARYTPKLGFVFTGQGAQWPSMGKALGIYPLYRLRIEEASAYMTFLGSPWSLKGTLP